MFKEWLEKLPAVGPKKQSFRSYVRARKMAEERMDEFKSRLRDAAGEGEVIANIKSERSFDDKTEDRGKPIDEVRDVLRGSILVRSESQIGPVVKKLKELFTIKKVDHKDKPEPPFGYYGAVHVDVVLDGMIAEVQVMTRRLYDAKLKAWPIYRKYRSEDEIPKEELERARDLYLRGNGQRP